MSATNPQSLVVLKASFTKEAETKLKYQLQALAWYVNECLDKVEGLSTVSQRALQDDIQARLPFPFRLSQLEAFRQSKPILLIEDVTEQYQSQGDKWGLNVAIFRKLYEAIIKTPLKITSQCKKDWTGEYASVPANEDEIRFYLQTNVYPIKGNKKISDFCRNYADVLRLKREAEKGIEIVLPDFFDQKLYNALADKPDKTDYNAYQKHLKEIGYTKKTAQGTGISYWSKT